MLTALVLQLIQCVVALPEKTSNKKDKEKGEKDKHQKVSWLLNVKTCLVWMNFRLYPCLILG